VYEAKSESLITELAEVKSELNTNNRTMIDYTQRKEQADEKITQLKADLQT
jgi:predicted  nucleic acid-binding Zn-ribbon protein